MHFITDSGAGLILDRLSTTATLLPCTVSTPVVHGVREATEHGGRSATKRRRTAVNTMAPKLKRTVVILRWLGSLG